MTKRPIGWTRLLTQAFGRCFVIALMGILCVAMPAGAQTPPQPAAPPHTALSKEQAKAAARFAKRVDALLAAAPADQASWGILVVDAETGETLYALNQRKHFVPASNMKVFTTALALEKLGVDYRFHTTLETHGTISAEGKLDGDVLLVGRGDPNLSNRKFPFVKEPEKDGPPEKVLIELADELVARGVREIAGDIVGDDSYFPAERYPSGWEIDDMVWEYGAAVSAIAVNDNTVTLALTPGVREGDAISAAPLEPWTNDFTVENDATTSAALLKSDLMLMREPGSRIVVVCGTLPAGGEPRKLVLSIEEPAEHAAALLQRLLEARGVRIAGMSRAAHTPDPASGTRTVLAEHVSPPLGETVKLVNKMSVNLHTEMLLRTAARQKGLWTKPEELTDFAAEFYQAAGIEKGNLVFTDGSGLSRGDLVTPEAAVRMLQYVKKQLWAAVYVDSLPVAGQDGTLSDRMKSTPAAGRIYAKTGTLKHVSSLSGFAETLAGREVIFSIFANNVAEMNHPAATVIDAIGVAMVEELGVAGKREKK